MKKKFIDGFLGQESYKYGFITDVDTERFDKGINEEVVRAISKARDEPEFLLKFRLKAFRHWKGLEKPNWASFETPNIDFQDLRYFSRPKGPENTVANGCGDCTECVSQNEDGKPACSRSSTCDPRIKETFERLGVPLDGQAELLQLSNVVVNGVFDSVSIGTTFHEKLAESGVIFCSLRAAQYKCPQILKKYLGSVVAYDDNFFSALNASVFSDGSFIYVPSGVRCPVELSTYFRINDRETGQFERTLIVAEPGSYVSYMEGCTAPQYDTKQLHAAVVELIAMEDAEIKYSTVQNWYSGDRETGEGGVYNFVTKRGACRGNRSKICWTQVEVGSAITWKYPSCILEGNDSCGEFYSVALTNGKMKADTGTKMIHIGKNTRSTIISKGIASDESKNSYRGIVSMESGSGNARNYTSCDSMLCGNRCCVDTFPKIIVKNPLAKVEHEASTSKLDEDRLLYLQSRGLSAEEAIKLVVNGFCKEIIGRLPFEFAVEAKHLLSLKLENSVG